MEEIWKDIKGFEELYQISNKGQIKSLNYHCTGKEKILKPMTNKGYLRVCLYKDGKGKYFLVHRILAETFIPNPNNYPQVNHKTENPLKNFVYINEDGTVDLEKSTIEWCTAAYNVNYGTRNERAGKKISESLKGKEPWNKGKKQSEEAKKKISDAKKGQEPWNKGKTNIYSEETKKKISESLKGRKLTEEHKKKMVAKLTNGKLSKPVLQINKDTNEVIVEFPSVSEAGRQLNFNISHVSDCCLGKRKTCGGFKWRYKT